MSHSIRVALIVICCMVLAACGDVALRDNLTQDQANEVVAALVERGIPAAAEREAGGRGKYQVVVKRGSYSEAVSTLHELRLPSEPRTSFAELIAPRGLMPDSREVEALRLDRALAAELEEAILTNPGIASVRVVVRLNSVSSDRASAEGASLKGAAAIIRTRPGSVVSENDLRAVMGRALPGVIPDNIRIEIHPGVVRGEPGSSVEGVERAGPEVRRVPLTRFLWVWRVPEDDYNGLAGGLVLGIIAVFALGIAFGALAGSARRSSKSGDPLSPQRRLPSAPRSERKRELPESPRDISPRDTTGGGS